MDRTERSINKHLLKWRNRLWLGHWLITPGYEEEMDARYEGSAYRTTAYIEADPTYKKAVITFATKTWKAMTPR